MDVYGRVTAHLATSGASAVWDAGTSDRPSHVPRDQGLITGVKVVCNVRRGRV